MVSLKDSDDSVHSVADYDSAAITRYYQVVYKHDQQVGSFKVLNLSLIKFFKKTAFERISGFSFVIHNSDKGNATGQWCVAFYGVGSPQKLLCMSFTVRQVFAWLLNAS